jgi:hypothetical protein
LPVGFFREQFFFFASRQELNQARTQTGDGCLEGGANEPIFQTVGRNVGLNIGRFFHH